EEFKTAYELWKQHGKPRMVLYRCIRALPFDVDPDQLKNVRAFFKLIEDVKGDYPTLYQAFDTTESFEKLVLNNLQKLLVEYGEELKTPITPEVEQVLAPKIPNNLPRRQAFFGRAKEMDTVMRALSPADRTWGVLVDGIGGIGKSAIAIEAAHLSQEKNLFDAFVFVTAKQNILEPSGIKELNPPARTLDEFLNETARVLGQSGITKLMGDEKRRALIDVLRSMHTLLIYDNLETLSKEEQEGIADFLRELPQRCKAIITSRRRGGEGAIWLRVEKLDWDAALGIIENEIARDAGLANKLNHVKSRWQELFDETNGSPLALVHTLGLMRVRATLTFDGTLEMLRGNRDADLQKFIFQEARKELTTNDKAALGTLSFFVPSATFGAWAEVANLSRNALETTIDRLSALSLVDVLIGEERYALHPLTRTFVRDELFADVNVARETGMQFAQYWIDYAERYGGESKESYQTYNRLEVEIRNLHATGNWLWSAASTITEGGPNRRIVNKLVTLARALKRFLQHYGFQEEYIDFNMWIYELNNAIGDFIAAAWRAYNLFLVYFYISDKDMAGVWAERCLDPWDKIGGDFERAVSWRVQGMLAEQQQKNDLAVLNYENNLAFWRKIGTFGYIASALNDLGRLAYYQERYSEAEQYYLEAAKLARANSSEERNVSYLNNLGRLYLATGQWKKAQESFEQSLKLAQSNGLLSSASDAQYGLARVFEKDGRKDLALPLAQGALKIYARVHHRALVELRGFVESLEHKLK
ncbi:MAG: tetratricopeptide repeat protein, partial [Chloroflexota bacterium]